VYNLYLKSDKRNNGSISDVYFNLPKPITQKYYNSFFTLKVRQLDLPFCWYQLNSSMATLAFTAIVNGNTHNCSITLTQGNYTITSLNTHFKSLIDAELLAESGFAITVNLNYDRDTMKDTVSILSDAGQTVSITIPYTNVHLLNMIGFTSAINISNGVNDVSDGCVNVNPSQNIYVRSSSISQMENYEAIAHTAETSDILISVPILVQPTNWIRYTSGDNEEVAITNKVIDIINMYITDTTTYDTSLELLLDWSIHIIIKEYVAMEELKNITDGYKQNMMNIENLERQKQQYLNEINKLTDKIKI
jgi:hypothetical protein